MHIFHQFIQKLLHQNTVPIAAGRSLSQSSASLQLSYLWWRWWGLCLFRDLPFYLARLFLRLILNQGQVWYGNYSFKTCIKYHIEASAAVNAKVTVTLWAFGNLQIDLEVTVAQEADGVDSVTNASLSNTFAALMSPSSSLLYSVPTRRAYITISDWCCPCGCSCLMKALCLYINSVLEWNIFQIPHSSSGRDLWLVHWEVNSPFLPRTGSAE